MRDEKGAAMMFVLSFFAIMVILSVAASEIVVSSALNSQKSQDNEQAMLIAKSVVSATKDYMTKENKDPDWYISGNTEISSGIFMNHPEFEYSLAVETGDGGDIDENAVKISATGKYKGQQATAVAYMERPTLPVWGSNPDSTLNSMIITKNTDVGYQESSFANGTTLITENTGTVFIHAVTLGELISIPSLDLSNNRINAYGGVYSAGNIKISNTSEGAAFRKGLYALGNIEISWQPCAVNEMIVAQGDVLIRDTGQAIIDSCDIISGQNIDINFNNNNPVFSGRYILARGNIKIHFGKNTLFTNPDMEIISLNGTVTRTGNSVAIANSNANVKKASDLTLARIAELNSIIDTAIGKVQEKIDSAVWDPAVWGLVEEKANTLAMNTSTNGVPVTGSVVSVDGSASSWVVSGVSAMSTLNINATADIDIYLQDASSIQFINVAGTPGKRVRIITDRSLTLHHGGSRSINHNTGVELYFISGQNIKFTVSGVLDNLDAYFVAPNGEVVLSLSSGARVITGAILCSKFTVANNNSIDFIQKLPMDFWDALE